MLTHWPLVDMVVILKVWFLHWFYEFESNSNENAFRRIPQKWKNFTNNKSGHGFALSDNVIKQLIFSQIFKIDNT